MLEKIFGDEYENIKNNNNLLEKSQILAEKLFDGKFDKGGNPYMIHLLSVSYYMENNSDKIVAILHDIIEDTEITSDDLLKFGYPKGIIDSIEILTRKNNEDYNKYIERIIESNDLTALNVKLFDLKNNMDISRIKNPTAKDYDRIESRYRRAYAKIEAKLEEMRNK